ncbi:hypothetical protein B0H63DRAFT_137621 [Podospora didyma]|uniref:LsmAD domain-containing protein n=1 Tax=Podospora didyma TaxID=330526 RepID=A0AAE0NRW1_9PEZI|nr:hypothetical protein B0H63DRAFT_137621 [Podospora didyma]
MEDRSSTSKPAISSPSQSSTSDIKSPTSRPLYSSKLGDQRGRPSESSTPNPTARQPPVKAWTPTSRNPVTGRSQTQQQPNFNSQNKQSATGALNSFREGQRVWIRLSSLAEFEGNYSTGPDSSSIRLNMVAQKKLPNSVDVANGGAKKPESLIFQRKEIADARAVSGNTGKNDGKAPNGNRPSFRTDNAISNSRPGAERALKPWVPDSPPDIDGSLERPGQKGSWDQFAVNENLFGVTTNYHESFYTTTIDKSHPQYKERLAAADKKAREIERSAPVTAHVAEERIMDYVGGGTGTDDQRDEEEKYSGVRRQDFPPLSKRENVYTPPARRAPTGHSTVKGAPVDPAIISSQLKAVPVPKQPENKEPSPGEKTAAAPATENSKPVEFNKKATETKPELKVADPKAAADKNATSPRPAASAATGKEVPNATDTVEYDVLKSFKTFATQQRQVAEKVRTTKAKQDKEEKLNELKSFANSFKLSTPVPSDLISIIAKDPVKQKAIQEKAIRNADEMKKAAETVSVHKDKEVPSTKASHPRTAVEQQPAASSSAAPSPAESRSTSRPTAPQHSSSQSGMQNRHPGGGRGSYNTQSHYQYNRNNRAPPHMAQQNQPTGNLAQRLRSHEQQKIQHPHMAQHAPLQDMRLPPTGPANNVDLSYGRRVSGAPQSYMGPRLNPNSHEFKPSPHAAAFAPAGPSQGSSPRSSVHNIPIVEPVAAPLPPIPVAGQLIRRKTKAVDVKKCLILSHLKTIQPPPNRHWDDNDGIKPSFDTPPTWRQLKDQAQAESPDSTMLLTYKEYFDRSMSNAPTATPIPTHVIPQIAHQHQLPFHLQHGAQNLAPRQSPHIPPMQMHTGQHGHGPHVPFSNADDHRMVPSHSAQSFNSPRMAHIPMVYPPAMNAQAQIPYGQPVMQPYMNAGAPPMAFRSFSNNPQFMPQQAHHMGTPMMVQPQFMPNPNGMVAGPQVAMYPGAHAQFMPPGAVPQQPMAGANGFPSPGRQAAAPMMAHQGSHQGSHQGQHQGQAAVYGMSPGMPYQQPYTQPQGKFSGQRPQ